MSEQKEFGPYGRQERRILMQIAKEAVSAAVDGNELEHVPPASDLLIQNGAAFVTLKKRGQLRGCIGHVMARIPLYKCVSEVARAAAIHDSRFSPVNRSEFADLSFEISILTEPKPISPSKVEIGKHGLTIRKGGYFGLLLPQVPVEWKWSREEFLAHTCQKAGLPMDAWHHHDDVEIKAFTAIVFDESDI